MSIQHKIDELPIDITLDQAVAAVYGPDIRWIEERLREKISALIECDMKLVPYLCTAIRTQLRQSAQGGSYRCHFVTGRPQEGQEAGGPRASLLTLMISELETFVRSAEENTIIVMPQIDLLTTTTRTGLSDSTKEVIALCHENPNVTILGFKDPSFELPEVISKMFPAKKSLLGIPRDCLTKVILRREAKKFGANTFDPFTLYKYVSGLNVITFRQIMEHIKDRMDFDPGNPNVLKQLYKDIRELTLGGELEVPRIDLDKDVGGYKSVKERIRKDILDLYSSKDAISDRGEVKSVEELIPKGIIFEGPPGTGKTFFAKAIATALDATVIVVSGPELKSKWVGESEQNLRNIFAKARKSAPAIIIFDEIDSFAVRRGSYAGSGVEHSMVNQLLTEMDGFRKEELVFIIATTNFVESLDEALLRPGRFELTIKIPYPGEKDREEILEVYKKKFGLDLPENVFSHLVRKTGGYSNVERRTKFSGDHIYAICRALARENIRHGKHPSTTKEVDEIIGDTFAIRPPTKEESRTIAVHESGHALAACMLENAPRPEKVSIEGIEDSPVGGYVMQERRQGDHVLMKKDLLDELCVLLAGRGAEEIVLGSENISTGAENDILRATAIAREMVERWGMSDEIGLMVMLVPHEGKSARRKSSDSFELGVDNAVLSLIKNAKERTYKLLNAHRPVLDDMIKEVTENKVLEREKIQEITKRHGIEITWNTASPEITTSIKKDK